MAPTDALVKRPSHDTIVLVACLQYCFSSLETGHFPAFDFVPCVSKSPSRESLIFLSSYVLSLSLSLLSLSLSLSLSPARSLALALSLSLSLNFLAPCRHALFRPCAAGDPVDPRRDLSGAAQVSENKRRTTNAFVSQNYRSVPSNNFSYSHLLHPFPYLLLTLTLNSELLISIPSIYARQHQRRQHRPRGDVCHRRGAQGQRDAEDAQVCFQMSSLFSNSSTHLFPFPAIPNTA
jgi:hypothetical protein